MSNNSFNKKKRKKLTLTIKVDTRKHGEVIMAASALRKVGMPNWHDPYECMASILCMEYDVLSSPIKCLRLYFMLHRDVKVFFGFKEKN